MGVLKTKDVGFWTLDVRKIRYILKWSSAKFYETGEDEFYFLTHYTERF
jgi:hypothetical protein